MPAPHSPLRPSSAYRWMRCTASPALIAKISPPETSSKAAEAGQRLHEIVASHLREEEMPSSAGVEEIPVVEQALTLFAPLREVYSHWHYEKPLQLRIGGEELTGTPDALGWNHGGARACILDWKFGRGIAVQARGNPQLLLYALMAREYFSAHALDTIREFELCIIQPRVTTAAQQGISQATYRVEELEHFRQELEQPLALIRAGEGVYHPHPDTCRFCPVKASCPAVAVA